MATTFVDYTGDGNATKSFSFPSIKEADIWRWLGIQMSIELD